MKWFRFQLIKKYLRFDLSQTVVRLTAVSEGEPFGTRLVIQKTTIGDVRDWNMYAHHQREDEAKARLN